jgi:cell wall-associated NlpC family hydrolase
MLPSTKRARHARCTYVARHARPSHLPAKVAAASAFGGVLIPTAVAAPAYAAEPQTSTVRVSGPGHVVEPGAAPVSVRLLADGHYVANGTVELQIPEGNGWRTVSRANTDANGLGQTTVSVIRDTPVRAYYRGSDVRSTATSSSVTIDVESFGQRVISEAAKHRGAPYRYGATGPSAFDCSGFTRYVFSRFGKSLPHNAAGQRSATQAVSRSSMRIGDLVFLDGAGHVGIYAGNGNMWDAPRTGETVTLRKIYSTRYSVGRVASA